MLGLPEIEVLRRDLEKEVVGRRVKGVDVRPGPNAMKIIPRHGRRKEFQELLAGAKVERTDRIGTRLIVELDNAQVLVVDLGQSGELLKTSASGGLEAHTHIVISFTIGGQLRIVDPTKTAELFVVAKDELESVDGLRSFALDPLEYAIAWPHFSALLDERQVPVKQLLMDSRFICGLGAVYSDEVLFAAGLRHDRLCNKLSSQDVRRLYRALMEILQDAVRARGTTLGERPFRDLQGSPGQYQLELKVFERDGESCRRCRSMVIKEELGGGVTYFCPQCQT